MAFTSNRPHREAVEKISGHTALLDISPIFAMDIDPPTASSSTSPLDYLEYQEASSPAEFKERWTKVRTAYERK